VPRLEGVDFVKGVSITAIVMFHTYEAIYGWVGHDLFGLMPWGLLRGYMIDFSSWESISIGLLRLTCLGYQGVHIFVVLSGFLQMWASRDREIRIHDYYFKRFLRLYPIYWFVVLSVIALNLIVHGVLGATPTEILLLFFGWAGAGLPFDSALWFMGLIIQLYLVFPFLLILLKNIGERGFLLVTWIVSVVSLYLLPGPVVGLFVGGWLFEFCVGMAVANHYTRVEPMLRGFRNIFLLLLAYLTGLMLSNFKVTWPLGRPLYGIAITLFIWSIYNTAREMKIFSPVRRFFIFMGLIAFPMWLINQPFMQEYYLLFASPHLTFWNDIVGDPANFKILPISKFLLVELNYTIIIIALSYILTRLDEEIARKTAAWQLKLQKIQLPPPSSHPTQQPPSPRDLSQAPDTSKIAPPQYSQGEMLQIEKKQLDELLNQNELLISRCRELLGTEKELKVRIALLEEKLDSRRDDAS